MFQSPIHYGSRLAQYSGKIPAKTAMSRLSYSKTNKYDAAIENKSALMSFLETRMSEAGNNEYMSNQLAELRSEIENLRRERDTMTSTRDRLSAYFASNAGRMVSVDDIQETLNGQSKPRPVVVPAEEAETSEDMEHDAPDEAAEDASAEMDEAEEGVNTGFASPEGGDEPEPQTPKAPRQRPPPLRNQPVVNYEESPEDRARRKRKARRIKKGLE